MTTDRKLRWGIIGPGGIAQAFRDGVKNSRTGELVAIASRNAKKAGLGDTFPGARILDGYDALLRDPGQLALLRDDPGLVANAVEEMLRYDSPVQASRRITLEPVTVGGVEIPAGAFVMASLASANRDEGFWGPDAAELRLNRENARQHVSFGAGPHHCLGASLARMEAAIAFERMTARFPNLAPDGEVEWNGRINLRGPARLPVSTG